MGDYLHLFSYKNAVKCSISYRQHYRSNMLLAPQITVFEVFIAFFAGFLIPSIDATGTNNITFHGSCAIQGDCKASFNLTCTNKTCSCNLNHYKFNTTSCAPKKAYNMSCSKSEECIDTNTACKSDKCLCQDTFFRNSNACTLRGKPNKKCVVNQIDESCVLNAHCNKTNFCVCKSGFKSTKDSCDSGIIAVAGIFTVVISVLVSIYGKLLI